MSGKMLRTELGKTLFYLLKGESGGRWEYLPEDTQKRYEDSAVALVSQYLSVKSQ